MKYAPMHYTRQLYSIAGMSFLIAWTRKTLVHEASLSETEPPLGGEGER